MQEVAECGMVELAGPMLVHQKLAEISVKPSGQQRNTHTVRSDRKSDMGSSNNVSSLMNPVSGLKS